LFFNFRVLLAKNKFTTVIKTANFLICYVSTTGFNVLQLSLFYKVANNQILNKDIFVFDVLFPFFSPLLIMYA
jgi:hypothetical protein